MSTDLTWRRVTCAAGECAEVATTADHAVIRSSAPPADVLALPGRCVLTRDEWAAFLAAVKAGEFDDDTTAARGAALMGLAMTGEFPPAPVGGTDG